MSQPIYIHQNLFHAIFLKLDSGLPAWTSNISVSDIVAAE
jgi:hypothetical protein